MAYLPASEMYINRESSFICTDVFIKQFKKYFLTHKATGKAILLLDVHTDQCSSLLLFQTTADINVAVIRLPNRCTHTLQTLD
jgi:hypothetical protein